MFAPSPRSRGRSSWRSPLRRLALLAGQWPEAHPPVGRQPRRPAGYEPFRYPRSAADLLRDETPALRQRARAAMESVAATIDSGPFTAEHASIATYGCPPRLSGVGLHRDTAGEFADAARSAGLKFGAYGPLVALLSRDDAHHDVLTPPASQRPPVGFPHHWPTMHAGATPSLSAHAPRTGHESGVRRSVFRSPALIGVGIGEPGEGALM